MTAAQGVYFSRVPARVTGLTDSLQTCVPKRQSHRNRDGSQKESVLHHLHSALCAMLWRGVGEDSGREIWFSEAQHSTCNVSITSACNALAVTTLSLVEDHD